MSNSNLADVQVEKKERYFEPAPKDIDVENFKKVIQSRRSVRKFTDKAILAEVLDDCLDMALLAPTHLIYNPGLLWWCKTLPKKNNWLKPA